MIVATSTNGGRENNSCRVNCLVDAIQVAPTSDLLDQDRRQSLGPKLLVDTEEVNFCDLDFLVPHAKSCWNTADGSH